MLFPALAIGLIAVGAWVGYGLFGDDTPSDVEGETDGTIPMLGMGLLAAIPLVMWLAATVMLWTTERRRASAVLSSAIVRWPQYSTAAQWQKVILDDHRRSTTKWVDVVMPGVIITVVTLGLAAWASLAGSPAFGVVLVAFWLAGTALVGGRAWAAERDRQSDRARRERIQPVPRCWVSDDGLYNEDTGLLRFDQIAAVEVVEPDRVVAYRRGLSSAARSASVVSDLRPLDNRLAKSGWSLLAVTTDSDVARTLWRKIEVMLRSGDEYRIMTVVSSHVRVPPDHIDEARMVAERIRARWLT